MNKKTQTYLLSLGAKVETVMIWRIPEKQTVLEFCVY